jgi:single-stranded DNA-binding protein
MGQKWRNKLCINHVQLIGFLGKDPEKRQVRGNGANFAVLSVATQQPANSVRRLSRAEAEVPTHAASAEAGAESSEAPF